MLKCAHRKAEFVLYNWDSISTHDFTPNAWAFDRIITFDSQDASMNGYSYVPLFCIREFQSVANKDHTPPEINSIYFVGNVGNIGRYRAVREFASYCRNNDIVFKYYLRASPVVLARLMFSGEFFWDVHLRSIPIEKFGELMANSNAVFDFANHQQSGNTMRVMENLCSGRKIITNNMWIRQESFFSEDRIHVYADLNFSGVSEFLARPLADPNESFNSYHIQSFVRTLLGAPSEPPLAGRA